MSTIWERVELALNTLGIPAVENVYIAATPNDLPDLYLVYFKVDGVPEQHADNKETLRSNRVQVSIYSRSGLADLPDVTGVMTAAGFAPGPDNEIPYNQVTRHYGLALEFVELEEIL